jgi:DNA-binding PadR family transcriptional regulator
MHRNDEYPFGSRRGRGGWFGRFGSGSLGGPGMRAAKMFASGDLQLIILVLLNERPRHGYEIIKTIEEHSSGIYSPSPGMVYPALTYLEEMGYATTQADGSKKLYRITESGAEHLAKNRVEADEALEQLARFGRKMAQFQQRFAEETEEFEDFDSGPRGSNGDEWRQIRREFHDLRDELKAVLRGKFAAPMEEKKRVLAILHRAMEEIRGTSSRG